MGLVIWVFTSLASAQAAPVPHPTLEKKDKQVTPAVVAPVQPPAHPAAPVYGAAVPEQTLPEPPEVVWDGKQLTIDAENSKLSDVLLAVRAKTGASVNFPAGAATSERVAVHLGPAPVREVLSSLLYGTDFDYVIQASSDDENALLSVVVTERGKGDDATVADVPEHPGMRLMPGYVAPGKRGFQAAAEAAAEAAAQADQTAPAPAPESASADADAQSPTSPNSANPGAESASSQPPTDQSPSADPGLTGGLAASHSTISSAPSTSSASSSPDGSPLPQMIQDMTRMFQQRAQIQAQQNQAGKTPAN